MKNVVKLEGQTDRFYLKVDPKLREQAKGVAQAVRERERDTFDSLVANDNPGRRRVTMGERDEPQASISEHLFSGSGARLIELKEVDGGAAAVQRIAAHQNE